MLGEGQLRLFLDVEEALVVGFANAFPGAAVEVVVVLVLVEE